ncbi:MucR family transcriptional regulator [Azospirillum sp. A29]|uniref:MucR family transcriptional regulator n=1 Tax=unclassified Azospirillum TaxID=2630922 RepID=UPI00366F82FB
MSQQDHEDRFDHAGLVQITTKIASAYLSNHALAVAEIPAVLRGIYGALSTASNPASAQAERQQPAVPIKRSVSQDTITCLECGQKNKLLKRHLRVEHDLAPDEYRTKWGLPPEYPMVAPTYAAARSQMAKGMGLGRRAQTPVPVALEKPTGRGRGRGKAAP